MNELKSYTEYAVSTPTADFVIGFDFNYGEDAVNVTVDDVPATTAGYTVVYLNETTIRLSPSVPSGVVRLQRETDIDQTDHAYRAGAKFIAQTMDENFEQLRHSQQEVRDGFVKLADDTYEIIDTLNEVGQSAQDAADAAEVAAELANNAAAQVNDKVSYEDFNNKQHNAMLARDAASAHPTSSILDASGETQQQVNYNGGSKWHSRVGGYLKNERVVLANGDIVKSTVDGNASDPNVNTVGWVKVNATTQIFDEIFGVNQSLLNKNTITVDNFGAKGDGVTDDSAAFQAYCDSSLTGQNLYLGAKGRYVIKNQIDLKGKGVVGNGAGKVAELYYNLGCIDVDGSSAALANKSAFINCGPTIQNLTARCSNGAGNQVSFIEIDGYLANIDRITLVNFYNQIVVKQALVGFNFTNAWLYYPQNAGIYCEDPLNRVSTTGTFHNIYFQLGDGYSMIFDRDIHGCDFGNIIFESMNGGIKARTVAHCGFGKFWCENLKTETSKDWLEVTGTSNSCYGNSFTGYIKLLGGWTSKSSPTLDSATSNNYGGVSVSGDGISIVAAGNKAKMLMLPSGFKTGNAVIDETHINSATVTPLTKRRVIGADSGGAQYLASDTYTKLSRKWGTYNHGSNNAGAFYAPMMLTYDQSFSTPQNNNGWQIVKESTGVYRVERVSGNTSVITNGHILVGSPIMSSRLGSGAGAIHGVQMIETYAGSWTSYTEAAGFKVFWRDASGTLVDPHRFTASFTATS